MHELYEKYGYKRNISKEEFDYFIIYAQNLKNYKETAKQIVDYREYKESPELKKLLKQSIGTKKDKNGNTLKKGTDTRIYSLLENVDYYIFNKQGISIMENKIDFFNNLCVELEKIINDGKLIIPENNIDMYYQMLYSKMSFIEFHNNFQA